MNTKDTIAVLYMEDDRGLARLLEKRLARTGIDLEVATDGKAGLLKCKAGSYDILLVDNQMPGMTGIEVIQQLAGQENAPPIIMVTGSGDEFLAVEAMKSGASDYIVKDTNGVYLDSVPGKIKEVLARHQAVIDKQAASEQAKEEQIRELDSFAHTVAHDLKAPIHQVKGLLDLLKLSRLNEDEFQKFATLISDSASKMENIIEELLLLSRIDREEVDFAPVDMNEVLERALSRLDLQASHQQANIFVSGDLPPVSGYAGWIEEVWVNFISNAIKYGGEPPLIEVGYNWADRDQASFWIRDNGKGLNPEQINELFIPFSRPGDTTKPGHGLGLSIVKRIIEKLGGTVGVNSTPGEGSTFSFSLRALPIAEVAAGASN